MALSRKKKIIIGSVVGVVLLAVVIISVIATRKEESEVVTVTIEVRPELIAELQDHDRREEPRLGKLVVGGNVRLIEQLQIW